MITSQYRFQALWNFCIDSPSSTEAFGEEEASELEKALITLLDTDLEEEDNCGDEVSVDSGVSSHLGRVP